MVEEDVLVLELFIRPSAVESQSDVDRDRFFFYDATLVIVILHQAQVPACQVSDCLYFLAIWVLSEGVVSIGFTILHLQEVTISARQLDLVIHFKLIREVDHASKVALWLFDGRPFSLIHAEFFDALPEHEVLLLILVHKVAKK